MARAIEKKRITDRSLEALEIFEEEEEENPHETKYFKTQEQGKIKIRGIHVLDLAWDLSNWMSKLPRELRTVPLTELAIPGTNSSHSYSIKKNSEFGLWSPCWMQKNNWIGESFKNVILKWYTAQTCNLRAQLYCGIRYFDFSVGTRPRDTDIYFVQDLFCRLKLRDAILEIRNFLALHRKEVVIVDFNNFYRMTKFDHRHLIQIISQHFSLILVHYSEIKEMNNLTLQNLTQKRKQVIVIYRHKTYCQSYFWESKYFLTAWPNTTNVDMMYDRLTDAVKHRPPERFLVTQCVITPVVQFIRTNIGSSLKEVSLQNYRQALLNWISITSDLNIVMTNFVDTNNWTFCKNVINKNYCLPCMSTYFKETT